MSPSASIPKTRALDQLCISTILTLSLDALQSANPSYPGHVCSSKASIRYEEVVKRTEHG